MIRSEEKVLPKALIFSLLFSVGLSACATTSPDSVPPEATVTVKASQNGDTRDLWSRVGAVPAQRVLPGNCGLFLWANMPERTLVFYTDSKASMGIIQLDGQRVILPRIEASGESILGHFFRQSFENDQLLVTVSFNAEIKEGLNKGAIVREGTWRIQEKSGWEIVAPIAGLIGCN